MNFSGKNKNTGHCVFLQCPVGVIEDFTTARSALGSTSGGAGSPNGLTEGVPSDERTMLQNSTRPYGSSGEAGSIHPTAPPQLRVRSAAFNRGMIATGNHDFERFAALCNTPEGAPRALRAACAKRFCVQSVTGEVREPMYPYNLRSVIVRRHCRCRGRLTPALAGQLPAGHCRTGQTSSGR